jgi:hypothetical protein
MLYTIAGKKDGFGSQYQAIMSGIAFCESKNYTYIHTPFNKMEHDVDVDQLNEFIGIKQDIPINPYMNVFVEEYSGEVHYAPRPSVYYTPSVLQKIRDYYYSTVKPVVPEVDIAIHIRRGDVNATETRRYTANDVYFKIIKTLRKLYPFYKITVFSEGQTSDFKELGLEDSCFVLNGDITKTFHSLVVAKILITANSSLSYAAGLLNENTVYHDHEFWHRKMDNWIDLKNLIQLHDINI